MYNTDREFRHSGHCYADKDGKRAKTLTIGTDYIEERENNLIYEVQILDDFRWNGFSGKILFSRYQDNNPALIYKTSDNEFIIYCSIDLPGFYREYPFGDNRLIVIKDHHENQGIAEALSESGVIGQRVFNVEYDGFSSPVFELSDQIVDLLKAYGEYYV